MPLQQLFGARHHRVGTMMEVADEAEKSSADCVDQAKMEQMAETAAAARGPVHPLVQQPPGVITTMSYVSTLTPTKRKSLELKSLSASMPPTCTRRHSADSRPSSCMSTGISSGSHHVTFLHQIDLLGNVGTSLDMLEEEYDPVRRTAETMMEVAEEAEKLPADCVEQTNDMEPKTETAAAARGPAHPLMQPPDATTTMSEDVHERKKGEGWWLSKVILTNSVPTFREELSSSWAPKRKDLEKRPLSTPMPTTRTRRHSADSRQITCKSTGSKSHSGTCLRHLNLGDVGTALDMLEECDPVRTSEIIYSLQKHDFLFVERSNGSWTYAIIAGKQEKSIILVVDTKGRNKVLHRNKWLGSIRLVNNRTNRANVNYCLPSLTEVNRRQQFNHRALSVPGNLCSDVVDDYEDCYPNPEPFEKLARRDSEGALSLFE